MFMDHQNSHYEKGCITKINTDSVTLYQNSIDGCRNKRILTFVWKKKRLRRKLPKQWRGSTAGVQRRLISGTLHRAAQWQGCSSVEQRAQHQPDFQQRHSKMRERNHHLQ